MKRQQNRIFWIIAAVIGLSLTAVLFISPALQAQDISSFEEERLLRQFRQVFSFIQENYVEEIDPDILIEGAMKGMFEALEDPYSAYLDLEDMRSLTDTTSGEFGGVGLYINKVLPDEERPQLQEWVEIVSPIEGTPAFRAGLRPRDLIVEIEGDSTVEMSIEVVVDRLRGQPGSDVEITVQRGNQQRFQVTLTRAIIQIPTVRFAGIEDDIGYIRIIQFTPNTAERTEEALYDLREAGYENFIIDLRTNPGGLLTAAIDTADLFFDDGLVVGTSGRVASENQSFFARQGTAIEDDANIVVLINEGTASAAEILAGALKDRDRAVLVGETSFGKGSVQQVRSLGSGGFRLTMARYFTPDEIFIDKVGIEPDVNIEEPELSDAENETLAILQNENRIDVFVDQAGLNPSGSQISGFLNELRSEGLAVNERVIQRLISLELQARRNENPVFDLEFDLVLQEALEIIRSGRTGSIIENRSSSPGLSRNTGTLPVPALP